MRKDWILDIAIGVSSIFIFAVALLFLPEVLPAAFGYVAAFLIFVLYLTLMGLFVVKRFVGETPQKKVKN
ncbi:MAG: hypothetical protein IJD66_03995 [Methanocorpusculum sp.]|nr:hypothetical protein [Methanocorpusculum parvum]MBQ2772230.1 hypothetical protein [Methanocorpusculum sp.]MBQ4134653.1 hypothetical protein [Methanocorpusculum sp.]MBR4117452.1 hypothetical protein [Methanocorpusculum sp.]HJJ40923.1 hypothetical protein [Methanocorpusculum sp.]